jgi:hypothetical protein
MAESPRTVVRRWLFTSVDELGNDAFRQQVHARIQHLFGAEFTPQDLSPRVGRSGGLAWQNNVDSLYDQLKHLGEMLPSKRGDPWKLSASSVREATLYRSALLEDVEGSLFADFKPKNSGEYVTPLQGRVLHKRRDHETTLSLFENAIAQSGWRPSSRSWSRRIGTRSRQQSCVGSLVSGRKSVRCSRGGSLHARLVEGATVGSGSD